MLLLSLSLTLANFEHPKYYIRLPLIMYAPRLMCRISKFRNETSICLRMSKSAMLSFHSYIVHAGRIASCTAVTQTIQ